MSKPTLLVPGNLVFPPAAEVERIMGDDIKNIVPVDYVLTWIKRRMPEYGFGIPKSLEDRILVVKSETGSGKSTVLPVRIYRILSNLVLRGKSVLCTQPRVLTAIELARGQSRADYNKDLIMGKNIGYQTGPLKEKPPRGLVYATIGVLLAQLRTLPDDEIIQKYKVIIIDEVHERSLECDTVLAQLKKFYARNLDRSDLPFLLLASATLDTKKYADYFGVGVGNIVEITGRTFPVNTHWPEMGTNDYIDMSAQLAIKIHRDGLDDKIGRGDILIFAPGSGEAKDIAIALDKENQKFRDDKSEIPPFLVILIDSKAIASENRDYKLLGAPPESLHISLVSGKHTRPFRRIIIASAVAETGLTIETLKYVIDHGFNRSVETYYPYGYSGLLTRPAAQSRIVQRKGRAGRLFPGEFYPTYTKNSFDALPRIQLPDIITDGPGRIFLDLVGNGLNDIRELDLFDLPSGEALHMAADSAIAYGFIGCEVEWKLTEVGSIVRKFSRTSMSDAAIILSGFVYGVSIWDLINIVCVIGKRRRDFIRGDKINSQLFMLGLPHYMSEHSVEAARLLISCEIIENAIMIAGFIQFIQSAGKTIPVIIEWCEKNNVKFGGIMEILSRRDDIINDLVVAGIDINSEHDEKYALFKKSREQFLPAICSIKQCLYTGLYNNILTRRGDKYYNKGKQIEMTMNIPAKRLLADVIKIEPVRGKDKKDTPLMYRLVANSVSVMDWYVSTDSTLFEPR